MKIYSCCGTESITKKYFCSECGGSTFEEKEVSDAGTVYSYTKIHIAPAEFADIAPYNVVLVALDEANAKVTTRIEKDVEIGDKVSLDRIENEAYIYKRIS
ncbi:Zn-ribbon domain-containing OB-fold protein [Planococcus kocurii]|uniref:Nucleic acid-binding protein n=1 Tax=Planococcus kocurii TaxID=1374 RepID=A0ABM5WYU6_9BACL|nr:MULTISPECIES: OB-fold domain-containing protein [Planococcus]ALS79519.1 nucleic acid-binding protein [Planococcus kocurii]KAA0956968.1 nucleic acid-binding protein [Planococcus sp. ANT_H30]